MKNKDTATVIHTILAAIGYIIFICFGCCKIKNKYV